MNKIKQKLPNYLTIFRVFIIPLMVISFFVEKDELKIVTASLFLLASISDFLDGYLSRKWKVESKFGTMLDPIADKLLVAAALCLIITEEEWLVVPAILIISREIFISGLREFLGKTANIEMPVSKLAKWKTASQMVSIIFLILTAGTIINSDIFITIVFIIGCIALWISAGLTLYTGYQYVAEAKRKELI
jgi:CDP-diacylglycerol--glycerol-3-phosphate 3-phosphatidyltransferase